MSVIENDTVFTSKLRKNKEEESKEVGDNRFKEPSAGYMKRTLDAGAEKGEKPEVDYKFDLKKINKDARVQLMNFYPEEIRLKMERAFMSTHPQSFWGKTDYVPKSQVGSKIHNLDPDDSEYSSVLPRVEEKLDQHQAKTAREFKETLGVAQMSAPKLVAGLVKFNLAN